MKPLKVHVFFKELGRNKVTTDFIITYVTENDFNKKLYLAAKKYLMSSCIDFINGTVWAGMHNVGEYRLEKVDL